VLVAHPRPDAHAGAEAPPQSTSVSSPFFTPSIAVATWQLPLVQTPLAQSLPLAHAPLLFAFAAGAAHAPARQTPDLQSPSAAHPPPTSWPFGFPRGGTFALSRSCAFVSSLFELQAAPRSPRRTVNASAGFFIRAAISAIVRPSEKRTFREQFRAQHEVAPIAGALPRLSPERRLHFV
jgi:hypothetical protein